MSDPLTPVNDRPLWSEEWGCCLCEEPLDGKSVSFHITSIGFSEFSLLVGEDVALHAKCALMLKFAQGSRERQFDLAKRLAHNVAVIKEEPPEVLNIIDGAVYVPLRGERSLWDQ